MRDYIAWLLESLPEEERDENWSLSLTAEPGPMTAKDFVVNVAAGTDITPTVDTLSKKHSLDAPAADAHTVQLAHLAGKMEERGDIWSEAPLQKPASVLGVDSYKEIQRETAMSQTVAVENKPKTDLEGLKRVRKGAALDALEAVRNRSLLKAFDSTRPKVLSEKLEPLRKQSVLLNALEAVRKRLNGEARKTAFERADVEMLNGAVRRAEGEETRAQSKAGLLLTHLQQESRLARFAGESGRERVQSALTTPLQPVWGTQADLSVLDRAAERDARGYDKGFSLF